MTDMRPDRITHGNVAGAGQLRQLIHPPLARCRNRLDPSHNEQNYASNMRQNIR